MFGKMKLKMKILVPILSITFIAFMIAVGFVTVKAREMAITEATDKAEEMAYRYGNDVRAEINLASNAARTLASSFEAIRETGTPDRNAFNTMMKKVLEDNPQFLQVWTIWEPNALDGEDEKYRNSPEHDDTGRFYPSWYRSGNGIDIDFCQSCETPGKGDYYLLPKRNGVETVLEPYSFTSNGKKFMATDIVVPIKIDGRFVGVVGVGIALDTLQKRVTTIHPFGNGYAALLSNKGSYAAFHDDARLEKVFEHSEAMHSINSGSLFTMKNHSIKTGEEVYRVFVPIQMGKSTTPWSFEIAIPVKTVLANANEIMHSAIIICAIALIILTVITLLIAKGITRPIAAVSELLHRIAKQDLTVDESLRWLMKYKDDQGELGDMYRSLLALRGSLSEIVSNVQGTMNATGQSAESLAALSEETNASMEEIAAAVEQVSDLSKANSSALENSNAGIQEVASSAHSAAQSVTEGAEAASKTEKEAQIAVENVNGMIEDINMVGSKSKEGENKITRLAESVNDIANFVNIITGIADQTNLLALNAAIEAARAGEAGRGFAVVADEVRKLAEESNKSAQEVGTLITTLQDNASSSMAVTKESGEIMAGTMERASETQKQLAGVLEDIKKIEDTTQDIASLSQEQAASSEEVAHTIDKATDQTTKVVEMVENIRSSSGEASNASENVALEAQDLLKNTEQVRTMLSQFKLNEKGSKAGLAVLD